jgi:hypothetical protein
MDFVNATIVPFVSMFILSIGLIVCVYRSRLRANSGSKRDNRFAISAISLNIKFLVFNFPISIYGFMEIPSQIVDQIMFTWFFSYFALGFYVQLIVNRDFRNELLGLFNLKLSAENNQTPLKPSNRK